MKTNWIALIVLFTFNINNNIMAQNGFQLQKEILINVPANQLWEMVGPGFVDVYKWSSNVDHAEGQGTPEFEGAVCNERFCKVNVKGFSSISEKLTYYSNDEMNLAYEVKAGMPKFVTKAANNWTVVAVGNNQSKLVMNAEFGSKGLMGKLMNGMMKSKMEKTLQTVLNDAKVYAETGQPSLVKQKRMEDLAKKNKQAA